MTRAVPLVALFFAPLLGVACGPPASAPSTPATRAPAAPHSAAGPAEPGHDPEAERAARVAMDRCGATEQLPALQPHGPDDDEYSSLSVSVDSDGAFVIRYSEWGNGVEASYGGFDELFDPRTCARLRAEWGSTDGDILRSVAFVWGRRGAPSAAEIVRLAGAQPADGASPAHAFARMRLLTRCPGFDSEVRQIDPDRTWDVLGPLVEAQPWLGGAPAQSVESFWTETLLTSIGARAVEQHDEDDEASSVRLDGVIVPATGPPERVRAIGALELWASSHDDRNGAVALALYDPARDRHRWIALTRHCVNGTTIDWIAADGDLLVGNTRSRHPVYEHTDGVIVVDAASAHAFVLERRGEGLSLTQATAWSALRARIREIAPSR